MDTKSNPASLDRLIRPGSVAVIGASSDPARIGGRPLRYLQAGAFGGTIYPVNPKHGEIQGLPSYKDISSVPGPVDLAIIAVPSAAAVAAAEACAAAGVGAAVVFSADFAESDELGRQRQDRLTAIARDSGMRILGPNCLGMFNAALGLYATFTSVLERNLPVPGRVALISQSGGYGAHLLAVTQRRGVDVGYWLTTGNEADVEIGECIAWAAAQPDVDVVMAYAEGARRRDTLLDGLSAAAAAGKPVLFMKSGRSMVGATAASTHTAALAGSDAVYDGLFRQFGAYRLSTTEEMADAAYACSRGIAPRNNRIGLITISGAAGVQMADVAEEVGLDVAPLPEAVQDRLKAMTPYAATRNPVDITAQAINDLRLVEANLTAMLGSADYGSIVAFFTITATVAAIVDKLAATLAPLPALYPDRLMILCIMAEGELVERYESYGYLVFEDPARAVRAAAAATFSRGRRSAAGQPPLLPAVRHAELVAAAGGELAAKHVLRSVGIAVPGGEVARSAPEAAAAAGRLGFPVAMKVASPDILHKTDVGGVALGLADAHAAAAAFETITRQVRSHRPAAVLDGVLVEQMVPRAIEAIVGVHNDPVLGPVVMCGLGGVFAEVFRDVAFRVAPIDEAEAMRMLREIQAWPLLDGFRGRPAADAAALARTIALVSALAAAHRDTIESIDINPVLVLENGRGAVAADAVFVLRQTGARRGDAETAGGGSPP